METTSWTERISSCKRLLVGLGEEWKMRRISETASIEEIQKAKLYNDKLLKAYEALYRLVQDKDYFIVTMATDAEIYETLLGSSQEYAAEEEQQDKEPVPCSADEKTMALMDRLFPPKEKKRDTRRERIVAPCGNETWRQCSRSCTKDIWEPGEIPEDICPHCGAPLTGNTVEAEKYIEEGYLPQWRKYTQWLSRTLNRELLILELGAGFANPSVLRFPFERTVIFNRKAYLYRVNERFPQIAKELAGHAEGIGENSPDWVIENF